MTLDWRPYFLRPETPPEGLPLPAYVRERMKDPNNPLKQRARAAGLKMVEREIIPSTRLAHQAAEFAREHGKLEPMHASLLRRYWSDGEDLGIESLVSAAMEVGLDGKALREALETGTYRDRVEQEVEAARRLGVSAVPTFVLDDRLAIQGAQEVDLFREAMKRIGAAPRES